MTQDQAANTVADALNVVKAQQEAARAQHASRLAEIDGEIERLVQSISNLQSQLNAVQLSRDELAAEGEAIDSAAVGDAYHGIFAVLRGQASKLAERTVLWTEAARAVAARRAEALADPETSTLVAEYEQFVNGGEAALAAVPASYRKVIEAHHATVSAQLEERLAALQELPQVQADELGFDVVAAVDADQEGGIAMIVTPVAAEVQTDWTSRDADLQTQVAARVVEGLYKALKAGGMGTSQAMFGGHQGLLALEVELPPGTAGHFGDALRGAIEASLASDELKGARVAARVSSVDVDLLLPPEDEEGDDA